MEQHAGRRRDRVALSPGVLREEAAELEEQAVLIPDELLAIARG
ncbi:MAG: hypothetical protein U0R69_13825 [Gaiellales bacterium]